MIRSFFKKGRVAAAVLAILCMLLPILTAEAALRRGSTGDDVIAVQKRLKQWGYYSGSVDGIYGYATERAVRWFQQKNGLQVDGVVGEKTAAAMGLTLSGKVSGASKPASGDTYLLAQCIYSEARGEPYKGQVAVGAVVLNRVKSSSFPNSISGVIYQKGAFSAVDDGQINLTPDETAIKAAKDALNGWDPTGGCLFYYNPAKTSNRWIRSRPIVLRIGNHVFCK
ncbi:MAG: spore cortex-lytic enzyme [Clostridia bacterium]|nr:spore cortex-lytic enzyme [Clostridia bacterium]